MLSKVLNILKVINAAISGIPLLLLVLLIGYIWLQYRSCYTPQPEVRIERIRDTVRTIKEIPVYFHVRDTVISERFIDRIFKPEHETIPVREEVVQITEVTGMEGEIIVLQDIFTFKREGIGKDGKVLGELLPTGFIPKYLPILQQRGAKVSVETFR